MPPLAIAFVCFFIAICAFTVMIVVGMPRIREFDRKRAVERDMRQDMRDRQTQRDYARKLLAEYEKRGQ